MGRAATQHAILSWQKGAPAAARAPWCSFPRIQCPLPRGSKVFEHVSMDALSKAASIELMKQLITD